MDGVFREKTISKGVHLYFAAGDGLVWQLSGG